MLTAMVDGYWLQALLYPKVFRAKPPSAHAWNSCGSRSTA